MYKQTKETVARQADAPGPSSVRYVAALVFDVPRDDQEDAINAVKSAAEKYFPQYPGVVLHMLSLRQVTE